jgi:hypothetical protein
MPGQAPEHLRAARGRIAHSWLAIGLLAWVTALGSGCSGDSDEKALIPEDPILEVVPDEAAGGEIVELIVEVRDHRNVDRGSPSLFEERSAGRWQTSYLLFGKRAVRFHGGPIAGVGIPDDARELVRIPSVPPGTYRITKDLAISKEEEAGPHGPRSVVVHRKIRVVR